jgi:mycothiol synthase
MNIRLARLPEDYGAIAAVLAAESEGWSTSAEELAYEDRARDPRYYHATLLAESEGQVVGVAFVGHDTRSHREGRFLMDLRVRPDWQGRGVGKELYRAVLDLLAPLSPREIGADVWEAHPRTARFLAERGFAEAWRRNDLVMDVTTFDFAPYVGLEERLRQVGIWVRTYGELRDVPDRLERLYELNEALWEDVPYFGQPPARDTLAQFRANEIDHPKFIADACFIALDGARSARFVGFSNLSEADEGYNIEMTGVQREYRSRGVGTLLKLCDIRYTLAHGGRRLWTVNDAPNRAIVALNEKLGFQRNGAILRFLKTGLS